MVRTNALFLHRYFMNVKIKHYFSLIKFSHTVFSLPFAIIGSVLGYNDAIAYRPSWQLFLFVLLCMFFARSAAMAFNRYTDAYFDSLNPRTQQREIPRGVFKRNQVLLLAIANAILFVTTTFFINSTVFFLSPVALLVILSYSYSKRFTYLSHVWLGVALALSPVGAYLVFNPVFSWQPILFGLVVLFWVSGFDIIYATQDANFDKNLGLYSIPAKFGVNYAFALSKILHSIAVLLIVFTGFFFRYSYLYWLGTILFAILLAAEHFVVYKNKNDKTINMAFATYNSIAGLLFGLLVIIDRTCILK